MIDILSTAATPKSIPNSHDALFSLSGESDEIRCRCVEIYPYEYPRAH
jgi:hypothetical protein